ncbi:MAG: metallophosphoesterase [Candidatus Promineifilaceae bacterium]|nr:metallophosphoesterase [Candidatus Promineifilaceae bacterium]
MTKSAAVRITLLTLAVLLAGCISPPAQEQAGDSGDEMATEPVVTADVDAAASTVAPALTQGEERPTFSPSPEMPTVVPTTTAAPTPTPLPAAAGPTSTPPNSPVTFAVIGDYGLSGQGTQDVAALVDSWDPDLVLTVGDNNYPDGAAHTMEANISAHYGRFIAADRFFPTLGNHDMTTENGKPYLEFFELPGNERYYDYVRGDLHFFALNSDWREPDGIRSDSRQAQWLQEQLSNSTAVWQIVYLHVPPYVSMADKEVPVLRWPFAAWGADLVLSGHAHLYERLQVDGIPYVVNGLGGTAIYPFDETAAPGSQVRFNRDYGALLVVGDWERLELQFITREGVVVDSFVVNVVKS